MKENWIIPCNVKRFNLIEHFKSNDTVVWRNAFTIRKGDDAYIYLSAPFGELRYKCQVIEDQVDEETIAANQYAVSKKKSYNYFSKKEKYIILRKVYEYPEGVMPLALLRENGFGQTQIQARTNRQLQAFIDRITAKCFMEVTPDA